MERQQRKNRLVFGRTSWRPFALLALAVIIAVPAATASGASVPLPKTMYRLATSVASSTQIVASVVGVATPVAPPVIEQWESERSAELTTGHAAPGVRAARSGDHYIDIDTGALYLYDGMWRGPVAFLRTPKALRLVGPVGPPGPKGAAGDRGTAGPVGTHGSEGAAGPSGEQRQSGQPGAPGGDGADGQPGQSGRAGASGTDGADGSVGPQGPAGPQGTNGLQGTPGPQGPAGADGATGPSGATGPAGPSGASGPAGSQGQDGATGAQGPAGPQGLPGLLGGYQIVTGTPVTATDPDKKLMIDATATCPGGTQVIGGGATITTTASENQVTVTASYPTSSSTWTARGQTHKDVSGGETVTVTAYAICAS
ncbi:MAG: collagen-like protein [Thermoleophilia bacterium]|nr:collagen-like protein [Thermoleophilia bacterium]